MQQERPCVDNYRAMGTLRFIQQSFQLWGMSQISHNNKKKNQLFPQVSILGQTQSVDITFRPYHLLTKRCDLGQGTALC